MGLKEQSNSESQDMIMKVRAYQESYESPVRGLKFLVRKVSRDLAFLTILPPSVASLRHLVRGS